MTARAISAWWASLPSVAKQLTAVVTMASVTLAGANLVAAFAQMPAELGKLETFAAENRSRITELEASQREVRREVRALAPHILFTACMAEAGAEPERRACQADYMRRQLEGDK